MNNMLICNALHSAITLFKVFQPSMDSPRLLWNEVGFLAVCPDKDIRQDVLGKVTGVIYWTVSWGLKGETGNADEGPS